jgi:hypothetical protein
VGSFSAPANGFFVYSTYRLTFSVQSIGQIRRARAANDIHEHVIS